jgi:ADP-ribosylglycohydrolase
VTYERILAVLAWQAVGDALGLPAEHQTEAWCQERYAAGGPYAFERVERPSRGEVFEAGEWSDDTDQALILVDSWLEHRCVNPQDIAQRLLAWSKTQKGMGSHTRKVLAHPDFATDPYRAAEAVWEESGRNAAPNGALMRAAVCGLFGRSFEETWQIAKDMARVTHADPRCQVTSAVVAGLVFGSVHDDSLEDVHRYLATEGEVGAGIATTDQRTVRLDGDARGYTLTTYAAAITTLNTFLKLLRGKFSADQRRAEDCLRALIRRGGDTDTNAAVAGALLGAATGSLHRLAPKLLRFDDLCQRAKALDALHQKAAEAEYWAYVLASHAAEEALIASCQALAAEYDLVFDDRGDYRYALPLEFRDKQGKVVLVQLYKQRWHPEASNDSRSWLTPREGLAALRNGRGV